MKCGAILALVGAGHALFAEGSMSQREQHQLRVMKPLMITRPNNSTLQFREEKEEAEQPGPNDWTITGPDSTDFNEETHVGMPVSVEALFAAIYILLIASAPIILVALAEEQLTRAHMLESCALITWLGGCLFLFTNILKFQSLHWTGTRPLTVVEAVYLLSQILTTIGYGDITPAFPRGQVWVAFNVIIALCLYASVISEVVDIVHNRVKKALALDTVSSDQSRPLKNWTEKHEVDKSGMIKSALFFATMATIGVFFWHFFPGEGKTWLQAVYMSIITLSTVGFGAFNATTEGGKVFAAFWMLVGVASLGGLIGSFIEIMLKEKEAERRSVKDDVSEFKRVLDACVDSSGKMDKLRFLKYGLMLTKDLDQTKFEKIEARFQKLATIHGKSPLVRRSTLVDVEGPPL